MYAIEGNHKEIVQLLINAGSDLSLMNKRGFTPKALAIHHDCLDLLPLFPEEVQTYQVPTSFTTYTSYLDLVPEFAESDM